MPVTRARVVQWDLHAVDAPAQRRFYTDVFGWVCSHPQDASQYGWMSAQDGHMLGGIGQANEGETPGVAIFVQVEDVPATMREAETLGGTVYWGPKEYPDGMVLGCIADPDGNGILLVHPSRSGEPYASRQPADPGQWEWEIQSRDPSRLAPYYTALFSWDVDSPNEWGWGKVRTGVDGGPDGAFSTGEAPRVLFYVTVDDLHAPLARVRESGGRIVVEPWQVTDELAIAVFLDPEGNRIGLRCPARVMASKTSR